MKIGVCLLMLASKDDPLAIKRIPDISLAGYDYAEIPLARLLELDESELRDYKAVFDNYKLPVEVFNNSLPTKVDLLDYERNHDILTAYMEKAIYAARLMGVKIITMCGPIREWSPKGTSLESGMQQYVNFLRDFANRLADDGIVLAIEPINSEENGFISTLEDALCVVKACECDNIKVIVDLYHFFKQVDNWELLLKVCKSEIVHLHFATKEIRAFPLESDRDECREELSQLFKAGYSGRISVEAKTENPEHDLPITKSLIDSIVSELANK